LSPRNLVLRDLQYWRREKSPPPTPPERIFVVFGVSWEGCPLPNNRRSFATLRTTRKKAEIPHKRRSGRHFVSVLKGVFCPFRLKRRSLASLEMTGYENHFCLSGKSWKGGEALVPILEMPSFARHNPQAVTPKCRSEGSPPFPLSLRAAFARSLLRLVEGVGHHPIKTRPV